MTALNPAPKTFAGGKAPPPRPAEAARGTDTAPALGRRVAIVEDELMVAWSLEALVEDLGYAVIGAYSGGEAALAGLDADPADIVLMDINLGSASLDGVETGRRLREAHDCRVVFISAYADPATAARVAEQVPGAPLLRKPVSATRLAEALASAADRSN